MEFIPISSIAVFVSITVNKTIRTMLYSSLASEDAGDILSKTAKRRAFIAINVSEADHYFTIERADIFNIPKTKILNSTV